MYLQFKVGWRIPVHLCLSPGSMATEYFGSFGYQVKAVYDCRNLVLVRDAFNPQISI